MNGCGIVVERPGALDTVQDLGRFGYQAQGFSPAGPMDRRSAAIANIVVGNPKEAALLECAVLGPALRFERACTVCLTGASMSATLDGDPFEAYRAQPVKAGATLHLGVARWGVYAYLAVAGGIDVPPVWGSRATGIAYGMGGIAGRPLRSGDVLLVHIEAPEVLAGWQVRRLDSHDAYFRRTPGVSNRPEVLRLVENGAARDLPSWRAGLLGQAFRVAPQSNRMGVRLEVAAGQPLSVEAADLLSEGVALGTVQLPAGGAPIVAMADHQTTGGYVKAGVVASVDLPRLAQRRPGELVRFEAAGVEAAQRMLRDEAGYLRMLRVSLDRAARRFG